jgi:hypothetical protein
MVLWNPATWRLDPKWPIISAMPTTQIRMLFLCGLDLLTFLWFAKISEQIVTAANIAGAVAHADPLILELFAIWLAFLAGCHGFSFGAYKAKRNTSWGDQNVTEDASDSTHIVTTEMPIPQRPAQVAPIAPVNTAPVNIPPVNNTPEPPPASGVLAKDD